MAKQINGRQRLELTSEVQLLMLGIKEMFPFTKKRLHRNDMWNSVQNRDLPNKRSVDKRQKHHGISTFFDLEI